MHLRGTSYEVSKGFCFNRLDSDSDSGTLLVKMNLTSNRPSVEHC